MFKKLGLVAVLLSASTSLVAGSISTGQLVDNYVGADGNKASYTDYTPNNTSAHYDTHWMSVERVTNDVTNQVMLNVVVNSNFVSHNNNSNFAFGDLFLMDGANYTQAADCNDGTGRVGCSEYTEKTWNTNTVDTAQSANMWEYAFDLGSARGSSYADDVEKTGKFRVLDGNSYKDDLDNVNTTVSNRGGVEKQGLIQSTGANRDWQAVMVENTTKLSEGTWNTNISEDLLKMSFDISNTSLATAEQIALRWAMTCANDIIEVVANFTNSTTRVSEPGTIALLISALAFLRLRRKA